jgi:hypothetical protein
MATREEKQMETPFTVHYTEDTPEGPRRRTTTLCERHADRFFQLHPDAFGVNDPAPTCIVCEAA